LNELLLVAGIFVENRIMVINKLSPLGQMNRLMVRMNELFKLFFLLPVDYGSFLVCLIDSHCVFQYEYAAVLFKKNSNVSEVNCCFVYSV